MELATSDALFFYSKSKDALPGKGANERVATPSRYMELSKFANWRRVLSNFHVHPFKYNGYTYGSIEHAFQAVKIALVDKDKAYQFTVDSQSELGLGNGADAQKARKLALLNKEQIGEWARISRNIMADIAKAKYAQCELACEILMATNDAELWHIVSRKKPERFIHLENIRSELCK